MRKRLFAPLCVAAVAAMAYIGYGAYETQSDADSFLLENVQALTNGESAEDIQSLLANAVAHMNIKNGYLAKQEVTKSAILPTADEFAIRLLDVMKYHKRTLCPNKTISTFEV